MTEQKQKEIREEFDLVCGITTVNETTEEYTNRIKNHFLSTLSKALEEREREIGERIKNLKQKHKGHINYHLTDGFNRAIDTVIDLITKK